MNEIRVAIVEDDARIRRVLEQVLSRAPGYQCAGAFADGLTAVAGVPALKPDVVIMDINLPGLSGLDALRALRDAPETREIPVIALSAAATERDKLRGEQAGFHRYLTKPVRVDELVAALEGLLVAP